MTAITSSTLFDLDFSAQSFAPDQRAGILAHPDVAHRTAPVAARNAEPDYECFEPIALIRVPLEPAAESPFMDA